MAKWCEDNVSNSTKSIEDREPINNQAEAVKEKSAIRVKELTERHRRHILMHFLKLGNTDRLLRFGIALTDDAITKYVQHIDFTKDNVFGVYDNAFTLVGVGHLAFALRDARTQSSAVTLKERVAEFGISVLESARGIGVGTKLFERAAIRCRNADVDTLYIHCLATNQKMIHIANKAGMEIQREEGDADAYLKLLPANPATVMREAMEEQVATFDYAFKANTHTAAKWFAQLQRHKHE
jgi:GNAT superfamily N-acetyltransferase